MNIITSAPVKIVGAAFFGYCASYQARLMYDYVKVLHNGKASDLEAESLGIKTIQTGHTADIVKPSILSVSLGILLGYICKKSKLIGVVSIATSICLAVLRITRSEPYTVGFIKQVDLDKILNPPPSSLNPPRSLQYVAAPYRALFIGFPILGFTPFIKGER